MKSIYDGQDDLGLRVLNVVGVEVEDDVGAGLVGPKRGPRRTRVVRGDELDVVGVVLGGAGGRFAFGGHPGSAEEAGKARRAVETSGVKRGRQEMVVEERKGDLKLRPDSSPL
jgi:hypothetical protein